MTNLCHFGCNQPALHFHSPTKKRKTAFWSCNGHQLKCPAVMARRKATLVKEYGVDNIFKILQTADEYAEARANSVANYSGVRNFSNADKLVEAFDAMEEKYGVRNAAQISGTTEKIQATNLKRYGYVCPAHKEQQFQKSKRATAWLDSLNVPVREYQVPCVRYVADGYDPSTNTIFEFMGNYWHGNPRLYAPDVYNDLCKKTMGQLYQEALDKVSKLEQLGYSVVVVWEDELH